MKVCYINLIVFRGRLFDSVVRICRGRFFGGLFLLFLIIYFGRCIF